MNHRSALILAAAAALPLQAGDYLVHDWEKHELSTEFWAEGANFGDFNKDGHNDIVAGPFWWAGPDFNLRHEYAPAERTFQKKEEGGAERTVPGFDPLGYSDNFFAFTHDINEDGWTDILILGFPGAESWWFENPKGRDGHWKRHVAIKVTDNESPTFGDLTGDGRPEIICDSGGYFGYASPDPEDPTKVWTFHRISPKGSWHKFTHGLGYGDVNGDGRKDILEKDGWWEQPASLEGDPEWEHHPFQFSGPGSAHMYAYDLDGDGDNDVITSLAAHGYGLAWYEHLKRDGEITFKRHVIMNEKPEDNKYGVKFSQLHAVDLIDMDGDGLKDIVTGKRWWAHGPHGDAEPNAPAVLYWFKTVRGDDGVGFIPHLIDDNSGIGTQVVAGRVNKDEWPDVVVGNKRGVFVFIHQAERVDRDEYQKSLPKPLAAQ